MIPSDVELGAGDRLFRQTHSEVQQVGQKASPQGPSGDPYQVPFLVGTHRDVV